MSSLIFIDTETTGLDVDIAEPWEIAIIVRDPQWAPGDAEYLYRVRPDLRYADPASLRVGRYYQRAVGMLDAPRTVANLADPDMVPDGPVYWSQPDALATRIAPMLDGATLIGSAPWYDASILARWLRRHGQAATWHHHHLDVPSMAVGYLAARGVDTRGMRSEELSRACGVEPPGPEERHTALGDARWIRDWYDAITGGAR